MSFGVIPVIGPVLAVGPLAAALISAAGGAAEAGVTGALIGWGIPEEDAQYYEGLVQAGRYLVTVECNQGDDAREMLARRVRPALGPGRVTHVGPPGPVPRATWAARAPAAANFLARDARGGRAEPVTRPGVRS